MTSNGTAIYSSGEEALFPLVGLVAIPCTAGILYYLSHRRYHIRRRNSKSRAHVFYRMLAGILLGQFIGHFIRHLVLDVPPYMLYVIIFSVGAGYFALDLIETVIRIHNSKLGVVRPIQQIHDEDIISADADETDVDGTVDEDHVSIISRDMVRLSAADTAAIFTHGDAVRNQGRRYRALATLYVLFACVCISDGLFLVYLVPGTVTTRVAVLVSYAVRGLSLTVAICGVAIHAKIHTIERRWSRLVRWGGLVVGWSLIHFLTTALPVLVHAPREYVAMVISHPAVLVIYGLASGGLLHVQQYFYHMHIGWTDPHELALGQAVFFSALGQSLATSLYL